jgi:hypothetical protein
MECRFDLTIYEEIHAEYDQSTQQNKNQEKEYSGHEA